MKRIDNYIVTFFRIFHNVGQLYNGQLLRLANLDAYIEQVNSKYEDLDALWTKF